MGKVYEELLEQEQRERDELAEELQRHRLQNYAEEIWRRDPRIKTLHGKEREEDIEFVVYTMAHRSLDYERLNKKDRMEKTLTNDIATGIMNQRITRCDADFRDNGGYKKRVAYCDKFDESCRERNRNKYDNRCFLCDKTENDNNRRLSVHHVDMNKDQGCNDHNWSLVPLCMECHARSHNISWQARIEYLLSDNPKTFKALQPKGL